MRKTLTSIKNFVTKPEIVIPALMAILGGTVLSLGKSIGFRTGYLASSEYYEAKIKENSEKCTKCDSNQS